MRSLLSIVFLLSLLLTSLAFTNPPVDRYQQHIYRTFHAQLIVQREALQKTLATDKQWATLLEWFLLDTILTKELDQRFIQAKLSQVTYQDYTFFSTLTVPDEQGKDILVSFGIFKQIFINDRWYRQPNEIGLIKFLSRLTPLSLIVIVVLSVMSIGTWYLIILKTLYFSLLRWRVHRATKRFWRISTVEKHQFGRRLSANPVIQLVWHGVQASLHHQTQIVNYSTMICSHSEFITRAMQQALAKDRVKLASGLTFLATVVSTAPFVGLLGTVVGIYSALMAVKGQITIEMIAAPVGEALIMTAFGLAVAIPAALAYNFFVRWQRHILLQLESFAHELHTYLNTGAPLCETW